MISYISALEKIFENLPELQIDSRTIEESDSHFLAEDISSPMDLPAFDNSAMDGYALKFLDIENAEPEVPVNLIITGDALAGMPFNKFIEQGSAVYVATGAVIPEGADAVVPIEEVNVLDNKVLQINQPVKQGNHIRFKGEEIKSGELVLHRHDLITPAHIGLLATFGTGTISVYRKPSVGFIATGDELVTPDTSPGKGEIRNSNTSIIKIRVGRLGCQFLDYGIAKDNADDLKQKIQAHPLPDVLLTSAGVSVGAYDFVSEAMEDIGLTTHFWKVAVKPGKPLVFGTIGKTLFFGLPGNPVSGAVVFQQFIEPVLLAMSGSLRPFIIIIKATSEDDFKRTAHRLHFARGIAEYSDGWRVHSAGKQASHMLTSLAMSNCYVLIPADSEIKTGDEVYIQMHYSIRTNLDLIRNTFRLFS